MFHKEHFCHVSSTNRGCPQYSIYVYKTTDSVETMLSAGYFNGALLDLHKNDVILAGIISDIDDGQYSTAWFRVIKRSLDAIEVEQVLTSADNITYDGTGTNYLSQFDNVQDAISALDAELKKESTERTQGQESLQGQIDGINEKIPETASASNQLATESDINTLQGQIDDNSRDIEALQGAGGALTAYNFNTATPTQETLTKYAIDQIWAGNTNWAWNAANPAASTFTDANGVARTAAEIFNSTWVNNTYDDHRWQLTNTQNTAPKVFEWADVGRDIVSVATATTAGIVRVGSGSQMVVNASTGDISLDGSKAESIRGTIGALASNQGSSNSGLILGIDADGDVVPTESGSGGRNIGDIFWTTRTDSALNGAVECNGATYNASDVNGGNNNIIQLLTDGKLDYISMAAYTAEITAKGFCKHIGWDGTGTTSFRVPTLTPRIIQKNNIPVVGNGMTIGLLTSTGTPGRSVTGGLSQGATPGQMAVVESKYGSPAGSQGGILGTVGSEKTVGLTTDAQYSGIIADLKNKATTERVMIQLFNSATDEAVAKCTEVLSDVAGLKQTTDGMIDYVVELQEPTEANGYTWYRKYKSGWVEQGGAFSGNSPLSVTLPIAMANTAYSCFAGHGRRDGTNWNGNPITLVPASTTILGVYTYGDYQNMTGWWEVKGMSAQ